MLLCDTSVQGRKDTRALWPMGEGYLPPGHRELESLSIRSNRRGSSSYSSASETRGSPNGSPLGFPRNDRRVDEHNTLQYDLRNAVPRIYDEVLIFMIKEDDLDLSIIVGINDPTAYSDPVLHG